MEPDDFCKKMPKSSQGKHTFPCDGDAVYPFANLQPPSDRHRQQAIWFEINFKPHHVDRAEKVRSFFIVRKEEQQKMPNPHFDISIVKRKAKQSEIAGAA